MCDVNLDKVMLDKTDNFGHATKPGCRYEAWQTPHFPHQGARAARPSNQGPQGWQATGALPFSTAVHCRRQLRHNKAQGWRAATPFQRKSRGWEQPSRSPDYRYRTDESYLTSQHMLWDSSVFTGLKRRNQNEETAYEFLIIYTRPKLHTCLHKRTWSNTIRMNQVNQLSGMYLRVLYTVVLQHYSCTT